METIRKVANWRAGKAWDKSSAIAEERRNWWNSPVLSDYVARRIHNGDTTGVIGAVQDALNGRVLKLGISVGSGEGIKEMALLEAGVIEHFHLYEVSQSRVSEAKELACKKGLSDRVTVFCEDAFQAEPREYDFVYWDHSLHHMLDVDAAIKWSVEHLAPDGMLVINDYIGPTRLQWTRSDTDAANACLRNVAETLGLEAPKLGYRGITHRLRMMLRDPSEAPQSDKIMDACRRHCGGWTPERIGCAMINVCGPSIMRMSPSDGIAQEMLIAADRAYDNGDSSHFVFGIWQTSEHG